MPDQRDIYELQAKIATLEAQLQAERATAEAKLQTERATLEAKLAMKEQQLEAERRMREDFEQANANVRQALEEAYEAQLQNHKSELALWRRDDVPGLSRWFVERLRVIDSTLAQLDGSPDLSEAMRARLDALRGERVEIEAIQARLSAR